jgi:hypothetical protein
MPRKSVINPLNNTDCHHTPGLLTEYLPARSPTWCIGASSHVALFNYIVLERPLHSPTAHSQCKAEHAAAESSARLVQNERLEVKQAIEGRLNSALPDLPRRMNEPGLIEVPRKNLPFGSWEIALMSCPIKIP